MRPLMLIAALATASIAVAQEPPDASRVAALRAHEAELLAKLHALSPEKHAKVVALKQTDPRAYLRSLWRVSQHLGDHGPTPEVRAEIAKLEAIRAQHPEGLHTLDKRTQKAIERDVHAIAERIFDLRQAQRRERVSRLQAALAELEADIADRDEDRADRLADFVAQFMRGRVDL